MTSHDQVGRALALMQEHGVSQIPVVSAEDESVFVGAVSEKGCSGRRPSTPAFAPRR